MQEKVVIGFAGMTHLGLNSVVAVAERGFECYCYDADKQLIGAIAQGNMPVVEPMLPKLWQKNRERLHATSSITDLAKCDVVYIANDVATDAAGQSDLTKIEALIRQVAANLNNKAILVILCQVPPGFTRKIAYPRDRLYYQVETLVFGKAVERALYPERYIVGCADASQPLPETYKILLQTFTCPILPMQYESAELAKIAINCCLVASVSVANTLAEVCENIGANWAEIAPALKLDQRIGSSAYLAPGLGIAGGNLERDLATVINLAQNHGSDASVIAAFLQNSNYRRDWALRTLHTKVLTNIPNATIGVLGLAYKANTHSIKNSPAIALLNYLHGYAVKVFDPVVSASVVPHVTPAQSIESVAAQADVLMIMTPWDEFKNISLVNLAKTMASKIIIDPYQVLNATACLEHGFEYFTLGIG